MYTRAGILRRWSLVLVVPCLLVLVLALSACGTNTTTGAAPGSTPPAATPTQSQANTNGCPNNTVMTTPPAAANVVLTNSNSGSTINAKKGEIIEIDLPFGHTWQGPTSISPAILAVQGPAGYAYPTAKACVWRFQAMSAGTVHLSFEGRPICKKGQACPLYIMAVPFTITIK